MSDASEAKPEQRLPRGLKAADYEMDDDGYPRQIVGSWSSLHKHALLRKYIDISGVGVRRKWLANGNAGATYIDLYCGPGRVRIKDTDQVCDGSPLVAWRQAVESKAPFTRMFIADTHPALAAAAAARLGAAGAPVEALVGEAAVMVDKVIDKLNPHALHFAFLDPFNFGDPPFEVVRKLAALKHMDILIHISAMDFNRNLRQYVDRDDSPLDAFAPGWREHVGDLTRRDRYLRARFLEHWRNKLRSIGVETAEVHALVTGGRKQPLYWLAFAARHARALDFWQKIRDLEPDPQAQLI